MQSASKPIACTLTAAAFGERAAAIADLANRHLLCGRRSPLQLHLTFASEASARARDIVAKEQACCGFLEFAVQEDEAGVHVTIRAPQEAREAADTLFAHFLPGDTKQRVKEETL